MRDSGEMARNMVKAFNDGYQMGLDYGYKVFKTRRKIEVEYIDEGNGELEFTKFRGGIINYGRSLPF